MRLALVYDRVNKIGGAERVMAVLHKLYPQAPLFTAVFHPQGAPWAEGWEVHASFLNHLPFARQAHELYPWLTPMAFESFDFTNFDVVISVTSADAKGILTKPTTLHLCYCLTPTRYLWSDTAIYRQAIPFPVRLFARPIFKYLRSWDMVASQRPDEYLTISKAVQQRIKKYYARESEVIYPPVDVEKFAKPRGNSLPTQNFFLVVSRLVPHKQIDLAIEACNRLKLPLVVVGTGWQMSNLKAKAGPTITFVGQLTDPELVLYYQHCRALIFPQEEDFGLSAVEAQAAGKPVIAYNKGGAREIVREGKTGRFFSQQNVGSLIAVLKQFDESKFRKESCQENAQRFSEKHFIKQFTMKVEERWEAYQNSLK